MRCFTHEVIRRLMDHEPALIQWMKDTDHNDESSGFVSDWHLEGSIWTHTMMVLSHLQETSEELIVAGLLHDVGKVMCRMVDEKVRFHGHSGVSTFGAIDLIPMLAPHFTPQQIYHTLCLINYHQALFDVCSDRSLRRIGEKFRGNRAILRDINIFQGADTKGRISRCGRNDPTEKIDGLLKTMGIVPDLEPSYRSQAVIMVGLPGSGKSTIVRENFRGWKVLSRDDIVMELAGPGVGYNYAFGMVNHEEVDKIYQERFLRALQKGERVVIDKTNLTYKGRKKIITQLVNNKYRVMIYLHMPSLDDVLDWNDNRKEKHIPTSVILNMMKDFNMPLTSEGKIYANLFVEKKQ